MYRPAGWIGQTKAEAAFRRWSGLKRNRQSSTTWLFAPDRVAVDEYVRAYTVPGAMKAGFEYYRAIPLTIRQNEELRKSKLTMPVLAIGGVIGAGKATVETMKLVSDDMRGEIIEECGHYTPEECPAPFLKLVRSFLGE